MLALPTYFVLQLLTRRRKQVHSPQQIIQISYNHKYSANYRYTAPSKLYIVHQIITNIQQNTNNHKYSGADHAANTDYMERVREAVSAEIYDQVL